MNPALAGGIPLTQERSVAPQYAPGPLAHPIGVLLPQPGGFSIGILGGMTKLQYATLLIAAGATDWDWENKPDECGDRAVSRAKAVAAAIMRAEAAESPPQAAPPPTAKEPDEQAPSSIVLP